MDPAVANALKRKEEIQRELAEIETFLALHRRFLGTKGESPDAPELVKSFERRYTPEEEMELEALTKPRGRPAELARMMEAILKDTQRPLSRGQFVDELEKRGHTIPSEDKARYLGTILWRNSDIFENLEGKGYWLKGVGVPDPGMFGSGLAGGFGEGLAFKRRF